jgi:hypothetical protein
MKKMMKNKLSTLALVTGFTLVSGCSGTVAPANVGPDHRTKVQMIRLPYMVDFEENKDTISKREKTDLYHFLSINKVGYGDELSADFALLRSGDLSPVNQKRLTYLSKFFKEKGIVFTTKLTPFGRAPKVNQGRILISRYIATPPSCGDYSQVNSTDNGFLPDHGCSLQAHLGMMVANPRDLINPIGSTGSDTDKAVLAVTSYKSTQSTVATVSTGGSGNK